MSVSRNDNLEQLEKLVKDAFDRESKRNNSAALGVMNHLDSYCNSLNQDASLDAKKAIVTEMKKEITTIQVSNPNLYHQVMARLNGLSMDYALAQNAERRAAEESKRNADIDARQSSRTNKVNPQNPPPVVPQKSKSFGFFKKAKTVEPESLKQVKSSAKSAPAQMVTTPKSKK
jgi:hypothetical protein